MARLHRHSEGSTGVFWGAEFCKANSAEVPASAIPNIAEIT